MDFDMDEEALHRRRQQRLQEMKRQKQLQESRRKKLKKPISVQGVEKFWFSISMTSERSSSCISLTVILSAPVLFSGALLSPVLPGIPGDNPVCVQPPSVFSLLYNMLLPARQPLRLSAYSDAPVQS